MKKTLLMTGAAALVLAACSDTENTQQIAVPATSEPAGSFIADEALDLSTPDTWGDWGINLETMDRNVHPGDNFYRYMNGTWLDTFEMPADRSRYGSFSLLAEKSEQRVRGIIEGLGAAEPDPATLEGKVAAIYNAYMDTDAIEITGLEPLAVLKAQIDAIETREDLARAFGTQGIYAPFGGWVDVDSKQTDQYIFYMGYGGLGMGDRDYYLQDTEQNLELREKYLDMVSTLLAEAGYEDPQATAQLVFDLEKEMARAHWDRAASRNRNITYNKMTREALRELAGDFPVDAAMASMGMDFIDELVVRQVTPTAEEAEQFGLSDDQLEKVSGGGVAGVFDVANTYDLDAWKALLNVRLIASNASVLPKRIDDTVFAYYGTAVNGQEAQRERWKRAVSTVEGSVGEAVGKVYAERYFPAENKAAMDELVENLRLAMADNLDEITWMGESTKVEARKKLALFTPKIGYSEKFETYDDLVVGDSAFQNAQAVAEWGFQDMISKLGQPIDKTEWFMLPQTVNAYYSPNRNEIVFPAAILQPPFFNLSADPAVNYGAIGGVIGHEMGHGFDDQGSRSDGFGMLRNWWTPEDDAAFKAKTSALAGQYDQFCPLDNGETCVNGKLSLGENIGDLGGLSMAYKAYKLSLDTNGDGTISADEAPPMLDGFTGDQRFFLAWAQVWRNLYREDALRAQLVRGPHSPPRYRVNGVVRNFDEWYEAFDVTADHELYLPQEERIRIW